MSSISDRFRAGLSQRSLREIYTPTYEKPQTQVEAITRAPSKQTVQNQPRMTLGTFDTSYYGKDLAFPFDVAGLTAQSITFSTATFGRNADEDFRMSGAGATAFKPLLQGFDKMFSNIDSGFILHEGDDTAFNHDFLIHPDMTAVAHQVQLSFAIGLNVSAYTSGNFAISSVDLRLKSFKDEEQPVFDTEVIRISPESAFSNLTGTGTQIMIIRTAIDRPFELYQDEPVTLNITVNETTGSGTRQVGLVDTWPLFATSGSKWFYDNRAVIHIHPIPAHVDDLRPFLGEYGVSGLARPQ